MCRENGESKMDSLLQLAALLHQYNAIGSQIAQIVGRPAQIGHVGEYIAAQVFDIRLEHAANAKGIDGYFRSGPLQGGSVNVKWYAKQENALDIVEALLPDYYLVLAGPPSTMMTSRGGQRPWLIHSVFLFAAVPLLEELRRQGVKLGVATSVRKAVWEATMIYPQSHNPLYVLSDGQRRQLALFEGMLSPEADGLPADLQTALAQMAAIRSSTMKTAVSGSPY